MLRTSLRMGSVVRSMMMSVVSYVVMLLLRSVLVLVMFGRVFRVMSSVTGVVLFVSSVVS